MPVAIRKALYRDIRPDLRERLRSAVSERDILAAKAATLDQEVDLLTKLLDQEDRRFGEQEEQSAASAKPDNSLADFISDQLKKRPMTKVELLEAARAAGYFPDSSGLRSVHATTINMIKAGKLTELAHNRLSLSDLKSSVREVS